MGLFDGWANFPWISLNLEQLIWKKALKFVFFDSHFPDLFTEVQIWYWKPIKFDVERLRSMYGFRKQLMIPDHEISVSIEHVVKSKIGKIFVNEDILEEKSVRIYEIDSYFSEHYKKNTSWW